MSSPPVVRAGGITRSRRKSSPPVVRAGGITRSRRKSSPPVVRAGGITRSRSTSPAGFSTSDSSLKSKPVGHTVQRFGATYVHVGGGQYVRADQAHNYGVKTSTKGVAGTERSKAKATIEKVGETKQPTIYENKPEHLRAWKSYLKKFGSSFVTTDPYAKPIEIREVGGYKGVFVKVGEDEYGNPRYELRAIQTPEGKLISIKGEYGKNLRLKETDIETLKVELAKELAGETEEQAKKPPVVKAKEKMTEKERLKQKVMEEYGLSEAEAEKVVKKATQLKKQQAKQYARMGFGLPTEGHLRRLALEELKKREEFKGITAGIAYDASLRRLATEELEKEYKEKFEKLSPAMKAWLAEQGEITPEKIDKALKMEEQYRKESVFYDIGYHLTKLGEDLQKSIDEMWKTYAPKLVPWEIKALPSLIGEERIKGAQQKVEEVKTALQQKPSWVPEETWKEVQKTRKERKIKVEEIPAKVAGGFVTAPLFAFGGLSQAVGSAQIGLSKGEIEKGLLAKELGFAEAGLIPIKTGKVSVSYPKPTSVVSKVATKVKALPEQIKTKLKEYEPYEVRHYIKTSSGEKIYIDTAGGKGLEYFPNIKIKNVKQVSTKVVKTAGIGKVKKVTVVGEGVPEKGVRTEAEAYKEAEAKALSVLEEKLGYKFETEPEIQAYGYEILFKNKLGKRAIARVEQKRDTGRVTAMVIHDIQVKPTRMAYVGLKGEGVLKEFEQKGKAKVLSWKVVEEKPLFEQESEGYRRIFLEGADVLVKPEDLAKETPKPKPKQRKITKDTLKDIQEILKPEKEEKGEKPSKSKGEPSKQRAELKLEKKEKAKEPEGFYDLGVKEYIDTIQETLTEPLRTPEKPLEFGVRDITYPKLIPRIFQAPEVGIKADVSNMMDEANKLMRDLTRDFTQEPQQKPQERPRGKVGERPEERPKIGERYFDIPFETPKITDIEITIPRSIPKPTPIPPPPPPPPEPTKEQITPIQAPPPPPAKPPSLFEPFRFSFRNIARAIKINPVAENPFDFALGKGKGMSMKEFASLGADLFKPPKPPKAKKKGKKKDIFDIKEFLRL